MLSYILQIITISITLGLGLFSAYQTKKIQHGQNIVSVTTNYRMRRCEQLKECGQILLSNSVPELLDLQAENHDMLKNAYTASETIGMIMHRHFAADKELIDLAGKIVEKAFLYNETKTDKTRLRAELTYKRKLFRIKCDIYTTADWNRIKSETQGVNTTSQSWLDYYAKLKDSFQKDIEEIETEYKIAIGEE